MRAKRATFIFWVNKSSWKMPKLVFLASFGKTETCGQIVLPDKSIQLDKNWWKMSKLKNQNKTFLVIFKQCGKVCLFDNVVKSRVWSSSSGRFLHCSKAGVSAFCYFPWQIAVLLLLPRISCLAFIMGTNLSSTHIHQFARQHYWSRWTDLQESRDGKIHHFLSPLLLHDDQQQAFRKITAYLDITVIHYALKYKPPTFYTYSLYLFHHICIFGDLNLV